jgi:hypothetical protein
VAEFSVGSLSFDGAVYWCFLSASRKGILHPFLPVEFPLSKGFLRSFLAVASSWLEWRDFDSCPRPRPLERRPCDSS